MSNLIRCIVDNVEYEYCGDCAEYDSTETWRYLYCCDNCRQIYHVIDKYKAGKLTDKKAHEMLSKLDMSNSDNFTDLVNGFYQKILLGAKEKEEKSKNKNSTQKAINKSTKNKK